MGKFQWLLGHIAGFCFMADAVQVFILPYIAPSIQAEMCLEDAKILWLSKFFLYYSYFQTNQDIC